MGVEDERPSDSAQGKHENCDDTPYDAWIRIMRKRRSNGDESRFAREDDGSTMVAVAEYEYLLKVLKEWQNRDESIQYIRKSIDCYKESGNR